MLKAGECSLGWLERPVGVESAKSLWSPCLHFLFALHSPAIKPSSSERRAPSRWKERVNACMRRSFPMHRAQGFNHTRSTVRKSHWKDSSSKLGPSPRHKRHLCCPGDTVEMAPDKLEPSFVYGEGVFKA
jgi:hypothetical protein